MKFKYDRRKRAAFKFEVSLYSIGVATFGRLVALLAPLVVLLVKLLFKISANAATAHLRLGNSTHSGQVDVGDDDLVQSRRSILAGLGGVTAGVVLVFGVAAGLPGLRVGGDANGVLGRGGSGVAGEMPAGETEGTGHDGEEDLEVVVSDYNRIACRWFDCVCGEGWRWS